MLIFKENGMIEAANLAAAALLRTRALVGGRASSFVEGPKSGSADRGPVEALGRRADGTTVPLECTVARLEVGGREVKVWTLRDVTERRQLERRILEVGEQLRRQIGQDLHDGLGQLLTGTAFLAKGLESNVVDDYRPQAHRVVELINLAIARVRNLARFLSPIHVEARSPEAVLRDVIAESAKVLGVDCVLELPGPIDAIGSGTIAQLCLIVREAVTNAVRHGRADRVVVRLLREGDRSLLSIEDNGAGIDESPMIKEGLGLRSMRQRAAMIGGALEVRRGAVGTVVRCGWKEGPA
jgi:signal transduction histidine kinase